MNSEQRLQHQQEAAQSQREAAQTEGVEFKTVDDMLRFDSSQNPVPPAVAERLDVSVAAEPPPSRSWLKKLFGG